MKGVVSFEKGVVSSEKGVVSFSGNQDYFRKSNFLF
jgi:hypothetical protein